jgi:NTE family protein
LKTDRYSLGLALGSGAARGLAHIGVLKALDAEGMRIDFIAGTSIGALIGALYAAGITAAEIERVACGVDWRQLVRLVDPILPTSGLIDGKKVARFISELLPVRTFEELKIPMALIATDVETGEALTIRQGNLLEALRAAVAFPGIFTPVRFGKRFLVDGGLCNPIPADVVRTMGADVVIGVCAIPAMNRSRRETYLPLPSVEIPKSPPLGGRFTPKGVERLLRDLWPFNNTPEDRGERKPPGIFKVCAQSVAIMENQINDLRLEHNGIDVLIRPELGTLTLLEFNRAEEAIAAGEEATHRQMEKIRRLVGVD